MSFDFRATLKRRIANENDPDRRDVWMMQDAQTDYFEALIHNSTATTVAAVNSLRTDEAAMRKLVLNGNADTHHEEHEWLRDHRDFSEANQALIDEARPLMAWVRLQMDEELDARKTRKTLLQKALEAAAGQIGTILVTAAASVLAASHFMKG